jgi:hypothetical protein
MTDLKIVWRNPDPVRYRSRRRSCKQQKGRTLYILQEYMADGFFGYWTTISALEMLSGGRAA